MSLRRGGTEEEEERGEMMRSGGKMKGGNEEEDKDERGRKASGFKMCVWRGGVIVRVSLLGHESRR